MTIGAEALLIITGSMGSGKTTVLFEASDILASRQIPHAAIELDALGEAHLPLGVPDSLMYKNLGCVWDNYAGAGVRRALVARAIETGEELERCRAAMSATNVVICRVTASLPTMQARVRGRETGMLKDSFVARVAELNAILDRAHLENFAVVNEERSITDVANEMLIRAGWLK